jgi:hypothetical protein
MKTILLVTIILTSTGAWACLNTDSSGTSRFNRALAIWHNAAVDYVLTGQRTPTLTAAIERLRKESTDLAGASDQAVIEYLLKLQVTEVRQK